VSGIILGLDTDDGDTAQRIVEFIQASHIPMLTINILYALPKTPLWNRLSAEGRLVDDRGRESNVDFKLPYATVLSMWRRCIVEAYRPEALYARYAENQRRTFPNRKKFPPNASRASWRNVVMGFAMLGRILWRVGVRADYRRTFWRMAGPALRRGNIEGLIHIAVVSHHLIQFTRDCVRGLGEASFYASDRSANGIPSEDLSRITARTAWE
jgi:hopanoid C-2 methylase